MRWDIFCRVIDNFGDVGVCWRLARTLLDRGETVRLWLDDPAPLTWMAPWTAGKPPPEGMDIVPWAQADHPAATERQLDEPGDVVIETFGCNLPDAFVAAMKRRADSGRPAAWINLEYLSAEAYVERSHGLLSPVMSGPGTGLRKYFFFPGFTPRTGGLLQPLQPVASSRAEVLALRRELFARHPRLGLASQARFNPWVLVFCYDRAPVAHVLDALLAQSRAQAWPAVQVLLTPGPAQRLARAWVSRQPASHGPDSVPAWRQHLNLIELDAMPQATFDLLLQATDLNLVRGEDSAVQALWAGRPHLWQLYEQDDGAHADKSAAFLSRWTHGLSHWPEDLRAQVTAWWQHWNGLLPPGTSLPRFPQWWQNPPVTPTPWHAAQLASATALASQADLVSQLMAFVKASG